MFASVSRLNEPKSQREAYRLVVTYTAVSVAVSAGVTYLFALSNNWPVGNALIPGVGIPLLVAPWMTWTTSSYALRLHNMRGELERLARTDPLSGALNRRGLKEYADKAFADRRRAGGFSAIVMDVDKFKSVNDTYGHSAGDTVIARVAEITRHIAGENCVVGRLGGDEMVAFFTGRSLEETLITAERIRGAIEHMIFIHEDRALRVTASIGVAAADADDESAEAILKRADQFLYAAKTEGRNRVRAAA
ncbi:MAG: hypothetical protein CTY15_07515 [Methylocystis sp.]|nr:MAG: hypothetical protein CTY15_07515 [Methylocystis sp.]